MIRVQDTKAKPSEQQSKTKPSDYMDEYMNDFMDETLDFTLDEEKTVSLPSFSERCCIIAIQIMITHLCRTGRYRNAGATNVDQFGRCY